jgi:hypothetical protein
MMSKPKHWAALGFALATSVLSVGACAPSGAYVEVDYVPRNIVAYPHVIYAGRTTYYVDGRWYYRSGSGWAYYRDPPARLREYRYERAPRAYPEPRYDHERGRREAARRREYERERHEEAYRRQYQHDRREDAHRREYEHDRREDARRHEHEHEHEHEQHEGHADARRRDHARGDVESAPPAERVR